MQTTLTRLGRMGSKWRDGPPSFEDPPNIMRPTSEPNLPPANEHRWTSMAPESFARGSPWLGSSEAGDLTHGSFVAMATQTGAWSKGADDLCLVARGAPVLEKISPKNWWDFHSFPWISVDQWTYMAIPCFTVPGPEDRKQLAFLVTFALAWDLRSKHILRVGTV